MKHKSAVSCFLSLLVFLALVSGATSCNNNDDTQGDLTNRGVINTQNFSLDTESVGLETQVHGSIFVIGGSEEPEDLRLRIVAWLEIDPDDFGGVSFSFPRGWEVSDIVSDYPQGAENPQYYVSCWQTTDTDEEWPLMMQIGHSKFDSAIAGGGQGALIFELKPDPSLQEIPESLGILAGAGSRGEYTVYPCYQIFNIALSSN